MDIKDCYNSIESQNAYLSKEGLSFTESSIFDLFNNKDVKILDLGCGGGRTTVSLINKGFKNIVGVDFAQELIEGAKKKYVNHSDLFQVGDATNLVDFGNDEFDIVFFSYNGLDYIQSRELRFRAIEEINRVLNVGGLFIFSSHNRLCLPINRNLLKTIMRNLLNINSEYWNTVQSFGDIPTYYSNPYKLELDLSSKGFNKIYTFPNNQFLFPFLDTFPYYVYKKI